MIPDEERAAARETKGTRGAPWLEMKKWARGKKVMP
jgi:hypothetical protein